MAKEHKMNKTTKRIIDEKNKSNVSQRKTPTQKYVFGPPPNLKSQQTSLRVFYVLLDVTTLSRELP